MATYHAPRKHQLSTSQTSAATRPAPPRYKLALLTWAGAYAVITMILELLGPAMATWPLPLRTLLLSALMAPAMTWLVIPFLTRLFRSWLASASPPPARPPSPPGVASPIGITREPAA
jgi:antibiotic biosynthesis monooxygenase (ABM) superfamily enzyme